jgi:hypothetical protein
MSATDRQNRLLVTEDWKRVYQTFRNADFQSYDFDNLRRTMITYLRENYPEDFNDYIESSEYLALIDLIAFLGQNLAFRIDLNARENFLELAERRESVLRLARLISYNPSRNQAANGLLKFTAIKTTEDLIDSNGVNLKGQTVQWNDSTNSNWFEQFIKVMNTSLPVNGIFGRPAKRDNVAGVPSEQYRVNGLNTTIPVYSFQKTVEGKSTPFQIVSTDLTDGNIEEEAPLPGNNFAYLYRDDGRGPGSSNTGFFAHFRQGVLDNAQFTVTQPTANQTVAVDTININDTDVWLYKLDSNANEQELWTKVDSVEGNNIIYNSINKNIRSVYSVLTRVDDRINLIFSDGVFGELPKGNFRTYYRISENRNMVITPAAMAGINFTIPYLSKQGRPEEITFTLGLQNTVANSSASESNASIKTNAPATYYTQNRMITGEDYNVAPLAISQEIVKVKSVNRTSSGISRFFDLIDATGKYSNTNLYGNDGIVYKEYIDKTTTFTFNTQTDIEGAIINVIEPILRDRKITHFYYDKFTNISTIELAAFWEVETSDTNTFTGFLSDNISSPRSSLMKVGNFTANSLRFLKSDSLLRFIAPTGSCFNINNDIISGVPVKLGDRTYIWTKVFNVVGDGTSQSLSPFVGAISLSDKIPQGAILDQILPSLETSLVDDVVRQVIDQAFALNNFGLRFDVDSNRWTLITAANLNARGEFNAGFAGDKTGQGLDASWLLKFETSGERYKVTYRGLRYVFESNNEIRFYYDSTDKIFDNKTGKIIKDKISVLNINTRPDDINAFTTTFVWEVLEEFRDKEGYVDSSRVEITFADRDTDGVVDDPDLFRQIVAPEVINPTKTVFQELYITEAGTEDFRYVDNNEEGIKWLSSESMRNPLSTYTADQVLYFHDTGLFKQVSADLSRLSVTNKYIAHTGRDNLKFHYVHAADANARIDPSASNIMDTYLLTRGYDRLYRLYLDGQLDERPKPPSSDELFRSFGFELNKIKSISDEIIYHPVKYKVLFGPKANEDLQATFKAVKNPELVLNDNDIKTRIISLVNQYFALDNWDFGDTYYFQELATYVMSKMAPDLVTLIIVPNQLEQSFGSLFEIRSQPDEIFISGASVMDIELIDEITASRLNASGKIITTSNTPARQGIESSASVGTLNTSGGLSF